MKQVAIRIRDWWRGYSDDDLRSAAEKIWCGGGEVLWRRDGATRYLTNEKLTEQEMAALRSCPDLRDVEKAASP